MDKYTEIDNWIKSGQDYHQGIELYKKYGTNNRLKEFTFVPANNFPGNRNNLAYELRKILSECEKPKYTKAVEKIAVGEFPPKEENPMPEKKRETRVVDTPEISLRKEFPHIIFAELPDQLKILLVNKGILLQQAKEATVKRDDATTDEERLKWNKIVVDSMLENQEIWDELNYFQENKKVLGKHKIFTMAKELEKIQSKTRQELFTMKQNFPSYISKVNKAIAETDDESILAKKRLLLEKYEWQEKEVDRLLGL